jgi:hypothetical protein
MNQTFAITFDYLCPFARNLNEAVVEGLAAGAGWDVTFRAFSLSQTKVDNDEPDVWERSVGSDGTRGVLALEWGVAVRDEWPAAFTGFHIELFAARHDRGLDIDDEEVLDEVARASGLVGSAVAAVVADGGPRRALQLDHEDLVGQWDVFGVPTLIVDEEAVFVRPMERHRPDEISQLLELVSWTNLNEFKRTRIPR